MPEYRLIKRPDSPRWHITWTDGGRSRRVPTGTEDKEQAQKILHLFALEREKPAQAGPDELAITQILGWYWNEVASAQPSKDQARIAIARFNDFFGIARVSAINKATHDAYQEERFADGVGWQTINRERMVLRAALNHAWKHHGLTSVPFVPTIPSDHPSAKATEPRGRPLSIAELATLYRAIKVDHLRVFFLLLLGTACRPDAARELRLKDQCDFKHRLINLNPTGRKQTKKRRPTVPMAAFLFKELKDAKRTYAVEFRGEPILSTKTAWRKLRKDAGLDNAVQPYSIRHTVARELRRRAVPGDQISVILGHRPEGTSRTDLVYAPYAPGYCRQACTAIQAIYLGMMREVARHPRSKPHVHKG